MQTHTFNPTGHPSAMRNETYRHLLFRFESELADSLEFLPMVVRFKLDTCGMKMKLAEWQALAFEERSRLMSAPCATPAEAADYRAAVSRLVEQCTGTVPLSFGPEAHAPWLDCDTIPERLMQRIEETRLRPPILEQWRALSTLQRYALIKLAQSRHDGNHFLPALQEFGWT